MAALRQEFTEHRLIAQDAHILGRLLAHPRIKPSNVRSALGVYNLVRRPFANAIVERSRDVGLLYEFDFGRTGDVRLRELSGRSGNRMRSDVDGRGEEEHVSGDKVDFERLGHAIYDLYAWKWGAMPDEEWKNAEADLYETLSS